LRTLFLSLSLVMPASGAFAANNKYAAIVVDAKTGKTLFARNADAARYPASLTKMMTLYILFQEIESGRFKMKSRLKVSKYAAARPPSKLGLRAGQTIAVRDAIRALAVKSANDVASVVAEAIEGSESAFAKRMTRTARSLGMKRTTFRNPSGLPDSRQKTTARDMARLGQALQDQFPAYYKFFSTRTFSYGKRNYRNTNRLLGVVKGMDGIKTGYTRASGFNLVTSVRQNDRHIIAVVMGGKTGKSRNAHMASLIKKHIRRAKRGKRRAPLIVASAPIRPAPLPRGRPLRPAAAPLHVASTASIPARKAVSPDPLSDLIATHIKSSDDLAQPETIDTTPNQSAMAALIEPVPHKKPFVAAPETSAAAAATPPPASKPDIKRNGNRSKRGGWYVQIAAVPTRESADRLLQQVQLKAGPVLASAEPLTQPVEKSGTTFYRARFAGFSGKTEARAVCARLKRKSVDCLAVPN
jgi:D-alanyl-D-alanine carboxypeptidase